MTFGTRSELMFLFSLSRSCDSCSSVTADEDVRLKLSCGTAQCPHVVWFIEKPQDLTVSLNRRPTLNSDVIRRPTEIRLLHLFPQSDSDDCNPSAGKQHLIDKQDGDIEFVVKSRRLKVSRDKMQNITVIAYGGL